jgi:hypothetical protein
VIKPISIVLAVSLASASAGVLAHDASSSTSSAQMQQCVATEKAKADGRTDTDINQSCLAKMQKRLSQAPDGSSTGNAPSSSGTSPATPTDPNSTAPRDSSQPPK